MWRDCAHYIANLKHVRAIALRRFVFGCSMSKHVSINLTTSLERIE